MFERNPMFPRSFVYGRLQRIILHLSLYFFRAQWWAHVSVRGYNNTIMHEKSLLTLEYPKILAKVAKEAAFSASKDLVMALEPTSDLAEARRRLAYTTEASRLIDLHADA